MPPSSRDLLAAARKVVPEVTVDEVNGRPADPGRVLLDDDELPAPSPVPRPGGWFEVFCCGTLVVLLIGGLILVALLTR